MNPNLNWALVAERMRAMQAEAEMVTRVRHARRFRRARGAAGVGRRHPGSTPRGITLKAGEAL